MTGVIILVISAKISLSNKIIPEQKETNKLNFNKCDSS